MSYHASSPMCCLLAAALTFFATATRAADLPPDLPLQGPARVASVDPRVPTAAGKPCVVELFRDAPMIYHAPYSYAPPVGCGGPWSKIILKADLTGKHRSGSLAWGLALNNLAIFRGGTPRFHNATHWHVERDLTQYAALMKEPGSGSIFIEYDNGTEDPRAFVGTAWLEFYPATRATPAPRVPDAIYRTSASDTGLTLPHNIERAYLDLFNAHYWWFTCAPTASFQKYEALGSILAPGERTPRSAFPPRQGCGQSSYSEIEITIDGQPAGRAPYFPLLWADFNYEYVRLPLDLPAADLQRLNFTPWRVDLTPFAAQLSAPGPHMVQVRGPATFEGQLLLFLDRGSAQVTGAITRNTLESTSASPAVTNTLKASGDVLRGTVVTRMNRNFVIEGVLHTSHGTITSRVHQRSAFINTQVFHLVGLRAPDLHSYQQDLVLNSTIERSSRRMRGRSVLSDDTVRVRYPLRMHYRLAANITDRGDHWDVTVTDASVGAYQRRLQDARHHQRARPPYVSHLREIFAASAYPRQSAVLHHFDDNRGSCQSKAIATDHGMVLDTIKGFGCPGGRNHVRWFAHPDGSPDDVVQAGR